MNERTREELQAELAILQRRVREIEELLGEEQTGKPETPGAHSIHVGGDAKNSPLVTGGGNTVAGGDQTSGDQTSGDQIEIKIGDGSTNVVAGKGNQQTVTSGVDGDQLAQLFAALGAVVERAALPEKQAEAQHQVAALAAETAKGKKADDGVVAGLIEGLVALAPAAVSTVVSTFATPILAGVAGPATKYVLDKIRKLVG